MGELAVPTTNAQQTHNRHSLDGVQSFTVKRLGTMTDDGNLFK